MAKFFRGVREIGVGEDEVILVHPGAAAGGVREDCVHIAGKCSEIFPRELLRGADIADVPRERAAARLRGRDDDLDAVAREHGDGRGIDISWPSSR